VSLNVQLLAALGYLYQDVPDTYVHSLQRWHTTNNWD
jgi:hypothetical protein